MKTLILEIRLLLSERATWALLLLFAGTLVYGIQNGARAGADARENAAVLEQGNAEWMEQVRAGLDIQYLAPRQVASRPTAAVLPPAPLPALGVGQSDLLPAHEMVSLWRLEKPSQGRAELENPARLLAGRFDLAFVLVWLFPLFLLAAAYDLCAGDREAGTLRMILAQGTSAWRWIGRRALARGAPVLLLATGATLVAGTRSQGGDTGPRVLLAVAATLTYGLFWLAIAALVNAFARSAASAAMAAGATWVLFVLVLPTLLNVVALSLHPSPSRAELIAEARAAGGAAEQRGNELLTSFYRDHPELAPPGMQADMLSRMLAIQEEVGRAMEPVKERFAEAILQQQRVVDLWRFASPAICVNEVFADLAGTGYWRYRAFQEQVAAFKEELHAFYSPKFHRRQPVSKSDLPNFPEFEFVEEDRGAWTGRVTTGLIGILVLTALVAAAAGVRLTPRRLAA
jgi:ABC-2 type transport system permease protein